MIKFLKKLLGLREIVRASWDSAYDYMTVEYSDGVTNLSDFRIDMKKTVYVVTSNDTLTSLPPRTHCRLAVNQSRTQRLAFMAPCCPNRLMLFGNVLGFDCSCFKPLSCVRSFFLLRQSAGVVQEEKGVRLQGPDKKLRQVDCAIQPLRAYGV